MQLNLGTTTERPLRILDFDTECRPLHYSEWRDESQITAYAWSWVGDPIVEYGLLRHHEDEGDLWEHERDLLEGFLHDFHQADIVTGHYILRHDLPLIVDHCMRLGLALPDRKLVNDTKMALPKVKGLGLSQDNLSILLGIDEKKHHMAGRQWAEANVLTAQGRALTQKRVVNDVIQHTAIRDEMLELGWMDPPVLWRP
jgi:hypothetical protein